MIDPELVMRQFLLAQEPLAALTGTRLYADTHLPPEYKPSQGAAILFNIRGGGIDYTNKVIAPSFQFLCYAATPAKARQLSGVLFDVLTPAKTHHILAADPEGIPTLLADPAAGWDFMLAFYQITMLNG